VFFCYTALFQVFEQIIHDVFFAVFLRDSRNGFTKGDLFVNIAGQLVFNVPMPLRKVLDAYGVSPRVLSPVQEILKLVRTGRKECRSGTRTYVHWYETDGTVTPVAERAYVAGFTEVGGCLACSQERRMVQGASYLIVGDMWSSGLLERSMPTPVLRQVFFTPDADPCVVASVVDRHMSVIFSPKPTIKS